MKKAFTLVEMLIVVVVLVTLMTMVFKLGSIGGDSKARNETVARIQRLEFAVSGYHAAFGTYPPVKLHGSRNIYLRVDNHGMQNVDGEENTSIFGWNPDKFKQWVDSGFDGKYSQKEENDAWQQVKAACRSQPVACEFPFSEFYKEYVEAASEKWKAMVEQDPDKYSEDQKRVFGAGFDDGVSENIGRHSQYRNKTEWRDIQLFRFGLLSYLLPRYLFMMNGEKTFFQNFAQWLGNNALPSDPLTGIPYNDWTRVQEWAQKDTNADLAHVANIPSQAACSRWMPTFEKSLCHNHDHKTFNFFGIDIKDDSWSQRSPLDGDDVGGIEVHSPGGYDNDSTSGQYVLDAITMKDGWGNDLYYYSPPPFQSYVIWSSGPNKRTFPPWISRKKLDGNANRCVAVWVEDDIVGMSH